MRRTYGGNAHGEIMVRTHDASTHGTIMKAFCSGIRLGVFASMTMISAYGAFILVRGFWRWLHG